MQLRKPHISEVARTAGSREKMVGLNGEVNASDNADLVRALVEIANKIQNGQVASQEEVTAAEVSETIAQFRAAYHDRNGNSWQELGAAIAAEVQETMNRDGFARNLMIKGTVAQGQDVKVRIHDKGMMAVEAVGAGAVDAMYYRNKYAFPKEFTISQQVAVLETEIAKDNGNILQDAVMEAREAIQVAEDQTWKRLADTAASSGVNPSQTYVGGMTVSALNATKALIEGYGIPIGTMLMASDCLQDLTSSSFAAVMGPIAQTEVFMTGRLGTILGMDVRTDAFRHRTLKVLNAGEIYLVGQPQYHGTYTDRFGVQARETDKAETSGIPARGWMVWEMISMLTPNVASIVKGQRA